jgi:hypothetical protein
MRLMAHLPLLAQDAPRKALLIAFGVGNTARAIASHRDVEAIDIVDLNDQVFMTAPEFDTTNREVYRDPRVRLIHDDGRRFLRRTQELYDLVTSEPPPPRASGVYRLYSVEYYRDVLERLTPAGMMTQWVPVYQLSRNAIDRVIASFVEVFPHAVLFVGDGRELILMGGRRPFDPGKLERRFWEATAGRGDLEELGIREPVQLLARVLRAGPDLRSDVAGARVISDQRNDLSLAVTDPFDPPRIPYDPVAVLRALGSGYDRDALEEVILDPRRLLATVPDFPL